MESKAEYVTESDPAFQGFAPPVENWSKLPHELINALPLIETIGEMKVILYVLRHTWGYQDEEKRISLDEFCNGRKHSYRYLKRHPDASPRIDSGTGLSPNTVKDGIERAVKHGFLEVDEDASDRARIKRWYSLAESGHQELTPEYQTLIPNPPEVDTRSEKETIERNIESPSSGDDDFSGLFDKPNGKPITTSLPQTDDPLVLANHTAETRKHEKAYTVPTSSTDASPWDVALDAWCEFVGKPKAGMTVPTQIKLKEIFESVGAAMESTAPEVADAIGRFKERYGWWDDDWPSEGFTNRLGMLLVPDAKEAHVVHTGYRDDSPGAV